MTKEALLEEAYKLFITVQTYHYFVPATEAKREQFKNALKEYRAEIMYKNDEDVSTDTLSKIIALLKTASTNN